MRYLLLGLMLLFPAADRRSDREALLAADRALSDLTAARGLLQGFLPAFADGAAYLHPGAPLLRGSDRIRSFLETSDSVPGVTWSPAFADVSADGRLGYTYGWTQSAHTRGKYLACWRKTRDGWRLAAYARTTPAPVSDSATPRAQTREPSAPVRGRADSGELLRADSAFAALSAARGAKLAFLTFAAEDAVAFGAGEQINEGRDAIGAGFDTFPAGAVLAWRPVAADIAPSGDLGCTVGEATIASLSHYSKYLTIWKRQRDGSWKFVADGGSARPAPKSGG